MKIEPFVENNSATGNSSALPFTPGGRAPQFENLLEWARLGSAHTRRNATCADKHRQNLMALVETEKRLSDFDHWRESIVFTEPEKAVLTLSETISWPEPERLSPRILEDARRHFSTEEIVRLTLTIMAVNDWIDLQQ
jgi:alkylhydroperoxidase family enzyme